MGRQTRPGLSSGLSLEMSVLGTSDGVVVVLTEIRQDQVILSGYKEKLRSALKVGRV